MEEHIAWPKVRDIMSAPAIGVRPSTEVGKLLIVGEDDWPTRYATERLLARLGAAGRLALVPRGDHLFTDPPALREAIALTVRWFESRLGPEAARAPDLVEPLGPSDTPAVGGGGAGSGEGEQR